MFSLITKLVDEEISCCVCWGKMTGQDGEQVGQDGEPVGQDDV